MTVSWDRKILWEVTVPGLKFDFSVERLLQREVQLHCALAPPPHPSPPHLQTKHQAGSQHQAQEFIRGFCFSYSAAELYFQTKYPSYPECSQSCIRMDVEAKFKTKSILKDEPNRSRTTFIFPMEVPVTEEFYTASPLSLGEHLFILQSE